MTKTSARYSPEVLPLPHRWVSPALLLRERAVWRLAPPRPNSSSGGRFTPTLGPGADPVSRLERARRGAGRYFALVRKG